MSKGLGKGINALFPVTELDEHDTIQQIKLSQLRVNPYQPRKNFDEDAINDLTVSIKEHGVIQPLIVRKSIKGYDIVAGERRFRAATKAKLNTVPVIVKELSDKQMMEIALIENLQREDLNTIEEAQAYRKLMEELDLTQEELAKKIGKSRPHIANHLRILQLSQPIQQLIADEKISMGHGRALLGLKDKKKLGPLVDKIIAEQMNVRQLEQLIQKLNKNVSRETIKKSNKQINPILKQKEDFLRERFGTPVSIKQSRKKGKIEIEYFSPEDLDRLIDILEGNKHL